MSELAAMAAASGMNLQDHQVVRLEQYCQAVWERNQQLNLTRHVTYPQFVQRDLWDSWQLSLLLNAGETVLDVGSGGGVPGIILGILRDDLEIHLIDSVGKKARALQDIVTLLGLPLEVHHGRAEDWLATERVDSVTARAVGPLPKLLRWFEPVWMNMRRLLAIKGPKWRDERYEADQARLLRRLVLRVAVKYPIPNEDWESVILEISPPTH